MSKPGFWLTRVTVTGSDVPDAEVSFSAGLNVISGPSDTGKTYIARCIDFLFGASKPPKKVPEAVPYELVSLGLRRIGDDSDIILQRSLRGGDVRLCGIGREERDLGARHDPDKTDTVSYFLLELSKLADRKVRTNKAGKTRQLSFRDIARLIVVDEEKVISERSPILSGQHTGKTVESSVFRLLLTGVDDASVILKADDKIARSQQGAKIELLDDLLTPLRAQIVGLGLKEDPMLLRQELEKIEDLFDLASAELQAEQETVAATESRRREAWTHLRQVESRMDVLSELQVRFELLNEQYNSDLRRLEAISDAGFRLGQMKEVRCPVCGALPEHHDQEHQRSHAVPNDVANACLAEAGKIQNLLSDLESTLAENAKEIKNLRIERDRKRSELAAIGAEMQNRLQPRVQAALRKFRESQTERDRYRRAFELHDQVQHLENIRSKSIMPAQLSPAKGPALVVGADEAEEFTKEVENLLRAWNFPNLDRVTFSEENQDLVISGRLRSSYGKGVRAVTHAAFNFALLKYCLSHSMPHPGLVVVDSPLVVYREPDPDERGFAPGLKDAFYRSLAASFEDSQVIILENEDPPDDIRDVANLIRFTGTSSGRYGFLHKQPS